MTVEDMKRLYSMRDIITKAGLLINRAGFCRCPFHQGDREPSLRVYDDNFHCFGCGADGDIITFVMRYYHMNFHDACRWISGEAPDKMTYRKIGLARMRKKDVQSARDRLKKQLHDINMEFDGLLEKMETSEPLSYEWRDAYNRWQYLCYKQDFIMDELQHER